MTNRSTEEKILDNLEIRTKTIGELLQTDGVPIDTLSALSLINIGINISISFLGNETTAKILEGWAVNVRNNIRRRK